MIFDSIQNTPLYLSISPRITQALEFILKTNFNKVEPGKIELDGENVFVLVQKYTTKSLDEGKWEAHKKYIDIQFMADGEENIGITNINTLQITQEYKHDTDFMLLQGEGNFLKLSKGFFTILFPHDAHMPGIKINKPQEVLKVVAKVLI